MIYEWWIEQFREETIVSYSGQIPGICLDVLWKNTITLFMVVSITSKIWKEQLCSRVLER
jgi:hypothetical protein